ncbi:MAG: pyridoxal 5'-phosphate synthase glutaminase subunit PdxT [Candidatus Zipacnadales bacterium]
MSLRIGVLALQGDFAEHLAILQQLDCQPEPVKTRTAIEACDGLVIPGGESTTIGTLIQRFGLEEPICALHEAGKPIFGTCAGLILLAKHIIGSHQWRLGYLDVAVERNAYGRQVDSFETTLKVHGIEGAPVRAVFIRAPVIRETYGACEVLAVFDGQPVLVRQGQILGGSFHPELVNEKRIHQYFLEMCA